MDSLALKGRGFSPAIYLQRKWALAPEGAMRPSRENFRQAGQTYFATFQTVQRQCFFRNERWSSLLLKTLQRYTDQLHLHDFVIMHDHIHLLLSPEVALEKAIQLVKGGFSFSARREFSWKGDIWQSGFTDHRIRNTEDFHIHIAYIEKNVSSSIAEAIAVRGLDSALILAPVPQWLKPRSMQSIYGGAEAPPLQDSAVSIEERTDIHYAKDAKDLFRKLGI
jgi:putative transposase